MTEGSRGVAGVKEGVTPGEIEEKVVENPKGVCGRSVTSGLSVKKPTV